MPIYEFLCRECGEVSTVLVLSAEDRRRKPECEGCGGKQLEKLVSRPGLVRTEGGSGGGSGELRPFAPRKMVEQMSRSYDAAGVDPGGSFDEISRAARRGEHPEALKKAVREAKAKHGLDESPGAGTGAKRAAPESKEPARAKRPATPKKPRKPKRKG